MILNKQPTVIPLYIACLLKKPDTLDPNNFNNLSKLSLSLKHVKINERQLNKFNNFYNISPQNNTVPFTFLHLLVFRPHLKLMITKKLPFPILGLVHIHNEIISYKDVTVNDLIDIDISISEIKHSNKGIDITLHSKISKGNILAWESFSVYLSPEKSKNIKKSKLKSATQNDRYEYKDGWVIPSNFGRRFAILSGDANPIHLFNLSAQLFGFKQAIAHGMCTAIKCVSHLEKISTGNTNPPRKLSVDFNKPVFLPSDVDFNYDLKKGLSRFSVTSQKRNKTLITGEFTQSI